MPKQNSIALTYPLRTAARLTGLSPELLRAWERRYAVVEPSRTEGGTRRYSTQDLDRLRLVKAAVDSGHRISEVAGLDRDELERRTALAETQPGGPLREILAALDSLDGVESHRLLSLQLSALGPVRFAHEIALPLGREIGERWVNGRAGIAQEHLATGVLRSLLGAGLQPTAVSLLGPRVVFGTPSGERHELGLLMAATTALGAGANPLYLGAELPVEDLLHAVSETGAAALALSLVTLPEPEAQTAVRALCEGLDDEVQLWLGGAGASGLDLPDGAHYISTMSELERSVMVLGCENVG